MPTRHPRIAVTKDETLAEALSSVAALFPAKAAATVVHDLAVKGAEAMLDEQRGREDAFGRLAALSTERSETLDWDILEQIDELAWGE
ncbi:MAG: hypothetical protein ACRET2_08250 [Steroidobacteraceae bacterium]